MTEQDPNIEWLKCSLVEIKEELQNIRKFMIYQHPKEIKDLEDKTEEDFKEVNKRINTVENRLYYASGVIFVLIFIVQYFKEPIQKIISGG